MKVDIPKTPEMDMAQCYYMYSPEIDMLTVIYMRVVKVFEVMYLTNLIGSWNLCYWKFCAMLISISC
jgi:hypothetical protein